jgi:hypothetical protein
MSDGQAAMTVMGLATAYWASRALHVLAELGVADQLGETPETAEALAAKLGVQPQPLGRLIRAVAAHGVFELRGEAFAHNGASRTLRSDAAGSMRAMARMCGLDFHWDGYRELGKTLTSGRPAITEVVQGDLFARLSGNAAEARIFHEAMAGKSFAQIGPVMAAYDFTRFGTIGDIGGGLGHLLYAALDAAPQAKGVLFDLPGVIAQASTRADPRVSYAGGDFFKDPIPACDAYLMMTVLHDWSDEEAAAILRNLKAGAPAGAKLLLVEGVVRGALGDFVTDLDVEMLVMTTGRERTEPEWRQVLSAGGFAMTRIVPTAGICAVIEAEPA